MDNTPYEKSLVGGFGRLSEEKKRSRSIDTIFGHGGQRVYENFTKKVPITTEDDNPSPVRDHKVKSSTLPASIANGSSIFKILSSKLMKNDEAQGRGVQFDGRSFLLGIIVSNLTFLFKPFLIDLLNHLLRFLGGLLQISVVLAVVAGVVLYLHYSILSPKLKKADVVNTEGKKKVKLCALVSQNIGVDPSEGDMIPVMTTRNDDAFAKFFSETPVENPKFKVKAMEQQVNRESLAKRHHHKPKYDAYQPKESKEVKSTGNIIPKRLVINDTEERIPVNLRGKKKINILPEELALLKKLAVEKYKKEAIQRPALQQPVKFVENSQRLMSPKFLKGYENINAPYYPYRDVSARVSIEQGHYQETQGLDLRKRPDIEDSPRLDNNFLPVAVNSVSSINDKKADWNLRKINLDENSINDEFENTKNPSGKSGQASLLKTPVCSEFSFGETPQSSIIMSDITNTNNDMKRGKPFADKSRRKHNNSTDKSYSDISSSSTLKGYDDISNSSTIKGGDARRSGIAKTHTVNDKGNSKEESNTNNKIENNLDTLTIGTMSVMGDSVIDDASIFRLNVRINEDEDDDMISMLSGNSETRKSVKAVSNNVGRMNSVSTAMSANSKEYAQFVSKVN